MAEHRYKGIAVSPGIVIGKAYLFNPERETIPSRRIKKADVPEEIAKLEDALTKTRAEILELQNRVAEGIGSKHAEIFNAHLLIVEDRSFIEEIIKKLEIDRKNVEYIFQEVAGRYIKVFSHIEDEYLKERASDIQDVSRRIMRNLLGEKAKSLARIKEDVVVIAYDLSPSDTVLMHKEKVIGFATDIGSRTSHTAIMSRSLEIPAVVGLGDISHKVQSDDTVIIDGNVGIVIIEPAKQTIAAYTRVGDRKEQLEKKLTKVRRLPAETKDGFRIALAANIELPGDVKSAIQHGAEGIGLYRTEFIYLNRNDLPTEEEQFNVYKRVVKNIFPQPVIIRTMDIGGDKFISHLQISGEMNPNLGWRAIRFSLARLDIFKLQLRAILRASSYGNLKIMYPMISGVGELRKANKVLKDVMNDLRKEGIKFNENIKIGAMIEVPSAAITADLLAKEVDFFSIGTNDLIQYTLAIDRVNEKVAYLYEPTHPALIRLIKNIIDVAHHEGIWVGMCGEMAGDPVTALIAVGLGIDELSTSALIIPEIKKAIRSVTMSELHNLMEEIAKYNDAKLIYNRLKNLIHRKAPDLLIAD